MAHDWKEKKAKARKEMRQPQQSLTQAVSDYQAAGADLGILGHHRVIFFSFLCKREYSDRCQVQLL